MFNRAMFSKIHSDINSTWKPVWRVAQGIWADNVIQKLYMGKFLTEPGVFKFGFYYFMQQRDRKAQGSTKRQLL